MNVTFDHSEDIAHNIRSFWFKPERPVHFIAGQFTELYLPHVADTRGQRRWFTISSSPTDPLLAITTKLSTRQGSTFKAALQRLEAGSSLKLAEPMGDFVLPKDSTIPLIFIAGGIGITPIHSMIKYLQTTSERRHVQLIYAVSYEEELIFEPLLRAYDLILTPVVKHPAVGYKGETGSLTADRIAALAPIEVNTLIYLAGPEPMVESLTKELTVMGIDPQRIVTDYFHGYKRF